MQGDLDVSNFSFSFEGSVLDSGQESELKVAAISQQAEAEGCLVIEIMSFTPPSEPRQPNKSASSLSLSESSTNTDDGRSSPSTSFANTPNSSNEDSPKDTETKKHWRSCSNSAAFLRSPSSWEVRGVKIYSLEEVEAAKGMEKKRRVFWNNMAKKLCKETTKPKQIIGKTINEEWRKEQGNLLLAEQDLLLATETETNVLSCRKLKPRTIGNNAQRIRNKQEELDKINARIDKAKKQLPGQKRKIELDELERTKKFFLSDMKKAQDAMRKNLKVKMSTVKDMTKH